jgi:hypothetical protein
MLVVILFVAFVFLGVAAVYLLFCGEAYCSAVTCPIMYG